VRPEVVSFGFAFNEGSFQASGLSGIQEFSVGPAPAESVEGAPASGVPTVILPLGDEEPAWFLSKQMKRDIGNSFREEAGRYFYPVTPGAAWDALIFVERTTRARPNP
jgi:erythromycin esterase